MRCLVLGALVVIASTGCGGPSENPELRSTELRNEWNARSAEDRAAIRKYLALYDADNIDTCVQAFDQDDAVLGRGPFEKPHRGDLAAYLCECLGMRSRCL